MSLRLVDPGDGDKPGTDNLAKLHSHAMDNLQFIRETMERAQPFTAVPGWGQMVMGVTALITCGIAATRTDPDVWLVCWMVEAVIALLIAGWAIDRKVRSAGETLFSAPARKFLASFLPGILAAVLLTGVLYRADAIGLIPGVWLLIYGVSVTAGGSSSVRIVPLMGLSFMSLGTLALLLAPVANDLMMGLGFGGLHLLYGAIIAKRYGG